MKVKVTGGAALRDTLERIPVAVAGPNLREAVARAAEPVRAAMARNAPRSDEAPHLADNIMTEELVSTEDRAEVAVGPSGEFFYGGILERGNAEIEAQPWARPAFDQAGNEALTTLAEDLAQRIERAGAGGGGE